MLVRNVEGQFKVPAGYESKASVKSMRNVNIDILRGVGMLLVIFGHSGCKWPLYPAIYAFHMPLFFIVSGFFYSSKRSIGSTVIKELNRLIIPYIAISLITYVILLMTNGYHDLFLKCFLIGNSFDNEANFVIGPIWFLLAMFWCKIIYRSLNLLLNIKGLTIILTILTILIVLTQSSFYNNLYKYPFCILQGIVCLLYYHYGHLLRENYPPPARPRTPDFKGILT